MLISKIPKVSTLSQGSLADRTVDAILAFMPSGLNIWAYDGSAFGMGDFSNNGKYMVTGGYVFAMDEVITSFFK